MTLVSACPTPSLAGLRDELRAAGLGRPAPVRSYAKFFFLCGLAFGGMIWAAQSAETSLLVRAPVVVLAAWFLTAAAMCGHDAAHGSTSDRPWANTLLAQLAFTFLGGLSVTYWRHKHNSLHHPNVNVAHRDPDVEQGLLALSARQHRAQGAFVRYLQARIQAYVFWLVGAPLLLVDLRVTSIRHVVAGLRSGNQRGAYLGDLAWIVAHYALWIGLPLLLGPVSKTLAVYAAFTVLPGVFLVLIFAPAHIPYPVVREAHDPLLLQLASTRSFPTNPLLRWTLIGLDRQIEHHLAPSLTHFELGRAAEIVRAYCRRHGLPYHQTGWARALRDTHVHLSNGWRIEEVVVGAAPGGAA